MKNNINFVFFGTPRRGVAILDILKKGGLIPSLIVTGQDMPKGRGLKIFPPEVKTWAIQNSIPYLQPKDLGEKSFKESITLKTCDLFLVVSYGKIMPKWLLDIPKLGSLNLHFSLLPIYRGAIPVEASILNGDRETGVSITLMDEKLDHGPIIGKVKFTMPEHLPTSFELVEKLSEIGGKLLLETIPDFINGKIVAEEQIHEDSTYCKKIKKEDAFIDLKDDAYLNWRKIRAYHDWPKPFFFVEKKGKKIRVIIREAKYESGKLEILRVIPEGKKEISYTDFIRELETKN